MTYGETINFLYGLRLFGAKFGLDNTRRLAALAGDPQNRLHFIHVAGTNGKGSTCAMLECIYRSAGLRVGLFTSPHLVSFRERFQVDRQLVSEADVVRLVETIQPMLQRFSEDHHPTFFEVITVMAMRYFEEQRCDLVIWETGLGGRLDATNIVTPLASVITNVQLDHQQWLGNTLAEIAAEKAGIIKPGIPVITGTAGPEARNVVAETARRLKSPLTIVTRSELSPDLDISLLGDHQQSNAAVAIATVAALQEQIPVTETQVRAGLSCLNWPGRLQQLTLPSGKTLLLDGAHNCAGATALRFTLEKVFPNKKPTLILGVLADKDWRNISQVLSPLADRVLTVPVSSDRSADASGLAAACRAINPLAEIVSCSSLEEAMDRSEQDQFVVVTGSLYLVGEALELLDASSVACNERDLNEWHAASTAATVTF